MARSVAASDARHRLVHEIEIGLLSQRSREETCAVADRQKAARSVAARTAIARPFPGRLGRAHDRPRTAGGTTQAAVRSHQHNVEHAHREIPIDAFALRDITNATTRLGHRFAEHTNCAMCDRHQI